MQLELIAAPDSSAGKTYRGVLAPTAEATLLSWLERSLGASSVFRPKDGETQGPQLVRTASLNGACWTHNLPDWRSDASVCSLSSILETGPVAPRFYLSKKACAGIIRRAEKRGKELPQQLAHALRVVAGLEPTSTSTGG